MKITVEDAWKNKKEKSGKSMRLTTTGLYVDNVYWYGRESGIIILDVTEDEKK